MGGNKRELGTELEDKEQRCIKDKGSLLQQFIKNSFIDLIFAAATLRFFLLEDCMSSKRSNASTNRTHLTV
jgi:hypothetical protein